MGDRERERERERERPAKNSLSVIVREFGL
jgi:hypothetical protein